MAGDRFETIPLVNGQPGQYIHLCGAYCAANLQWVIDDGVSTVYVQNGTLAQVRQIADSALAAGPQNP